VFRVFKFGQISDNISETAQDRDIFIIISSIIIIINNNSDNERLTGNYCGLLNGINANHILSDLELIEHQHL